MSQSSRISKQVGGLEVLVNKNISSGSTASVNIGKTPAPAALTDAATTLTVAQLKTGILTQTPSAPRICTLPTAAAVVSQLAGGKGAVGDSVDFSVINLSAVASAAVTIAAGTGGSVVGNAVVHNSAAVSGDTLNYGSAMFRVRVTNATSGAEAYVVYRL